MILTYLVFFAECLHRPGAAGHHPDGGAVRAAAGDADGGVHLPADRKTVFEPAPQLLALRPHGCQNGLSKHGVGHWGC